MRLEDGLTHVVIEGPLDGTPLLMIHGATVPHWEFDFLAPRLVDRGFRVLRYDLYGHGHSDRPRFTYTLERFVRQAEQLLDALNWPTRNLRFLGHSLGAAIAARLAATRPERFTRGVLMAPMLDFSSTNPMSWVLRRPILGEALMGLVGVPLLVRRRRRRYRSIDRLSLVPRFVQQVRFRGFGRALLSMERAGTLGNQRATYREFAAASIPSLVVWGSRDGIVPREHVEAIRLELPRHEYREFEGLEHNLMLTHPERIAEPIADFLQAAQGSEIESASPSASEPEPA